MFKTLKAFLFAGTLSISVAVFLAVSLSASVLYESMINRQAHTTSRVIAQQTFGSMFQLMRSGWTRQQLLDFLDSTRASFRDSPLQVEVVRGPRVEALFGEIEQIEIDTELATVLHTGEQHISEGNGLLTYIFPLIAQQECVACHTNAATGDPLGAIRVRQDLSGITDELRQRHLLLFILLGGVVLAAALLLSKRIVQRIDSAVLTVRERLDRVARVTDLTTLSLADRDLGFRELDGILDRVGDLVERLKHIAIDKDVLHLEGQIMARFAISSEVVKDWREYLTRVLGELDSVIETDALYVIYRASDGPSDYEIDVFWSRPPDAACQAATDALLNEEIGQHAYLRRGARNGIRHTVLDEGALPAGLGADEVAARNRYQLLETPRVGGVVGVGLVSPLSTDPDRAMLIEAALGGLLNLAGSVRAINKFTRDLEYYATRDPLADVFNQRMFWELLGHEVSQAARAGREFAVMVLDLDNFKTINDRYGHAFGDHFLKAFVQTLRAAVRDYDIVTRYGGDEFALILPDTDQDHAYYVALRITDALDRLTLLAPDQSPVKSTCSVGISVYPRHGQDARDLFLIADNMMYKAKRGGKNAIALPSETEIADVFRQAGDTRIMIMSALEDRRIVPYFQPFLDTRSGTVVAHELLMRIRDGERIIPAGEFIEIAEELGLVHRLDYLCIEQALIAVREQDYQGILFMNLSPRSLILPDFIDSILALAIANGVRPEQIVFELTERETVRNITQLQEFVAKLHEGGFKFAIDDFGSGYSSFHYIKRFPIDYIKIEGDFIRNMLIDEKDMAFVKSITTLARELRIDTVAEFVERGPVLKAVGEIGIDLAQGHYIAHAGERLLPLGTPLP